MGLNNSRRMAARDSNRTAPDAGPDSSDSESEESYNNYAHILQSLINSGRVQIMNAEDNVREPSYLPILKKLKPDTKNLDGSEFSMITKQASGLMPSTWEFHKNRNLGNILMNREKGLYTNSNFSYANKCNISNRFLPNKMTELHSKSGKVFCGIFSKDGDNFITATQDRQIRLYDSSNGSYKLMHSLYARDVGWSILDLAFSPDRKFFIYTTWSSAVFMCSVSNLSEMQVSLKFVSTMGRFCIFSLVFSSDGRELLGGANDGCLYIYDRERNARSLKIRAHAYDVNSVVFADDSSHIIYSGGDDALVKVWDRRTLNENSPNPVGILAGHMDGITFIDSRGDGRHLISNSKDQSIKLWDIRVFSREKAVEKSLKAAQDELWDYRWQEVPTQLYTRDKIDGDTSVMTYRGHVVVKTLIRCRFSPVETTGQRYIYTGCGLGRVVVYDTLTGKIRKILNGHVACVRDVGWHPMRNEILSSSWDGIVGKWTYANKEETEETDRVAVKGPTKPLRRSLRLALRSRKDNNN